MSYHRSRRGMEIAPFRGLRFDLERAAAGGASREAVARAVTAPPYDVISPEEHRKLLAASPFNIAHITLGSKPAAVSSYEERASLLDRWVREGILFPEEEPSFYVYRIDYAVPGETTRRPDQARPRARFTGLVALGRLHPFADGIVLPHERTFPKVVDDRLRLLEATHTNLESIFLLYSDPERTIDHLLEAEVRGEPVVRVEAKPDEHHELYRVTDVALFVRLMDLFLRQRPIIADGHHRYTTSMRLRAEGNEHGKPLPGSDWQLMTFANLYGDGLSILATHRLVKLTNQDPTVFERLLGKFEPAPEAESDLRIETRERKACVRFPAALKAARKGVARTSYALLHDVVIGEWLHDVMTEAGIHYFKEGTGETEALARGDGDILFRMKPVDPPEFQEVVQGGEVFPHKTTYFYPKLWSGLVLWAMDEPETLALK